MKSSTARRGRKITGPERFESRWLLDAALPALMADSVTLHANDDPQSLAVLSNDQWNLYNGPRRITALSFPTGGGSAEISGDGQSVLFRPAADFSGDESFSYLVDDQFTAVVSVHVVSPLADDSLTIYPDGQPQTLNVLANDPFWAGYAGPKVITAVSASQLGGTVTIAADGHSVIYSAPDDPTTLAQVDHFSYFVDDKYTADVALNLFNPLSSDSQCVPQSSDPIELKPLDRAHFTDWPAYGGPQRITSVLVTSAGSSATIAADGRTIVYAPAPGALGGDRITYVVDGRFSSTIAVQIGRVVEDDNFAVDENDSGTPLDVLANDVFHDVYSDTSQRFGTTITSVTQGAEGGHVEILDGGRSIRYTPAAGFIGDESFTYRANNRYMAHVTVNVSRPARDDYYGTWQPIVADSQNNLLDVLSNDFYHLASHTITSVGATAAGGTLTIQPGGQRLLYSPKAGFVGQDSFTYTIDDQYSATVLVNVQSPASDFSQQLAPAQNFTYSIALTSQLRNYTGAGVVTAISVLSGHVAATISSDGKTALVTSDDFSGATISYTIDGKYTGHVTLSFSDSLYLAPASGIVDENSPGTIDVLANTTWKYFGGGTAPIVYQGPRLLTGAFGAAHGTLRVAADGKSVIYTPAPDYFGADSFEYLVDGHELSTASVETIRRVRDDQFHVDASSNDNVLAVELNDELGGGYLGSGLITGVSSPAHGTVTIGADGRTLHYTPASGYSGADSVTYTVDGHLKASVQITVAAAQNGFPKFDSLADFEDWLIQSALARYSSLFGQSPISIYPIDFAANEAGSSHSDTNTQVAGIDEADLTETDGNYIYVLSGGKLVISRADGTVLSIASQTAIDGSPIGIYLSGDRVTVISQVGYSLAGPSLSSAWIPSAWGGGQTIVTVLDVADRVHPQLVQKTVFDGVQLETRRIGDFVYLALNSNELTLPPPQIVNQGSTPQQQSGLSIWVASSGRYETQDEYLARVRQNIGELLDTFLPHFRSYAADGSLVRSGLLVTPEEIGRPVATSNDWLVSIATINVGGDEPGFVAATGVLSTVGARLYMNHDSVYVFGATTFGDAQLTDILKFTVDETTGQVTAAAHGQVSGSVLDQFSIDEENGFMSVATTVTNVRSDNWSNRAENDLWVLQQDGDLLELVGSLQNLAHGESIRSVRFDGDLVLITTFPTVQFGFDPVYAIDLSNPAVPRFVGELTLPGYSQYMQFIDATHVLTVGVNAPTNGGGFWSSSLPLQVSLFDISDFAHPHLLAQYTPPRFSTSLAQNDHHAFQWFAGLGILGLPVARSYVERQDLDGDGYRETTVAVEADEVEYFRIQIGGASGGSIQPEGSIELNVPALQSAFIDDTLYAIGNGQIVASSALDPGTPLASVTWATPPALWPIGVLPVFPFQPVLVPPVSIISQPVAIVSPVIAPTAQQQLTGWIDAARSDLAARLGVPAGILLLVSVEAPPSQVAFAAEPDPTGLMLVLQSGERMFSYRVSAGRSLLLDDADFHYSSAGTAPVDNPTPIDVNGDGQVSARDALRVINDLVRHRGGHRADPCVLRQSTEESSAALDVNHDGLVNARDVLLIIHAIEAGDRVATSASMAGASTQSAASSTTTDTSLRFSAAAVANLSAQKRHDLALAEVDDWSHPITLDMAP